VLKDKIPSGHFALNEVGLLRGFLFLHCATVRGRLPITTNERIKVVAYVRDLGRFGKDLDSRLGGSRDFSLGLELFLSLYGPSIGSFKPYFTH
jgi:hypothetical protein